MVANYAIIDEEELLHSNVFSRSFLIPVMALGYSKAFRKGIFITSQRPQKPEGLLTIYRGDTWSGCLSDREDLEGEGGEGA